MVTWTYSVLSTKLHWQSHSTRRPSSPVSAAAHGGEKSMTSLVKGDSSSHFCVSSVTLFPAATATHDSAHECATQRARSSIMMDSKACVDRAKGLRSASDRRTPEVDLLEVLARPGTARLYRPPQLLPTTPSLPSSEECNPDGQRYRGGLPARPRRRSRSG